jgi:hypothetical protein
MVFSLKKNQPIRRAYDTYDSVSKRVFHIVATNTCLALYYKPTIGPKLYFSPDSYSFLFVCVCVCEWVCVCVVRDSLLISAVWNFYFVITSALGQYSRAVYVTTLVFQNYFYIFLCVDGFFTYVFLSFWVFLKSFLKTGPDGPQFSLMYFSLNNSTSLKYSAFYALSSL